MCGYRAHGGAGMMDIKCDHSRGYHFVCQKRPEEWNSGEINRPFILARYIINKNKGSTISLKNLCLWVPFSPLHFEYAHQCFL